MRHLPTECRSSELVAPALRETFRRLAAGTDPWPLTLWGEPGVGKTCAALAMLDWTAAFQPKDVLGRAVHGTFYWTATDYVRLTFHAEFGRVEVSPGELKRIVCKAALIVIDELDRATDAKDSRVEAILDLVDWRKGRPLVLISNGPPEKVAVIYGKRLSSRMSAGVILRVDGPDRRGG